MAGIFSIGVSGLNASQTALVTISHNIANVNTQGYTRQVVSQAAQTPQFEGFGFVGNGVDVTQVARSYNKYLSDQVLNAQTTDSYHQVQLTQLNQVDNLMGSNAVNLSPSLQAFFQGLRIKTC